MSPGPGAASAPDQPADPAAPRLSATSTFSSLRIRNYRIHFVGSTVSNIGTWMQRIAQDWLVHTLTGSATAVGATVALQFLPMLLFGLYGGVLADRLDKRKLLLCTQSAMGLIGLTLAALTFTGQVHVYHVYALAFALGLATVADNPARQTFVSELVGPALLPNAVSLNSASFQSARIIGPAVAGVLITAVGSGWAFLYNGLSFLAPVIGLLLMRTGELIPTERAPRGKGQLREGLAHVRARPELLWPIVLVGFVGTFGFNFPIWLVAFTDRVFHSGAGTYGLLNTLMAVGSLTGALLAAKRGSRRMRFTAACAGAFGLLLVGAAGAPVFWLFAALMVPLGLVGMTFMISANTSLQMASGPAMRGRVMSLYMMVFLGSTPIGAPLLGWVTDHHGPRIGLLTGGLLCAGATVGVALILARIGGLRLKIDLRPGHRHLAFVPRATGRVAPAPGQRANA
ncbi:MFS transporter [Streptomyces aidingensis]|uniref:Predicted arabinose efflux permease, MFS family n=1 Tax=Streptomyces aidingensis TaxID=910347 RepID=A0A1I1HEW9_9ACTN|nr:MFS transporter [Streptomyces aidingensis]SFC22255.1 Predicted arabinose efflux permease, MFS family [Streptomyces aidingensis]